ncbi:MULTISPECIES: DNA adenine methylase [unclassified Chelatococcus]|uniref:DNA adenine methylase n=1 Tax=unclassified Chelatococcus TaxID=2638111 RepID=UPI001BCB115E|nr:MULTISPECIES: DNA adenine methylase [unclassified Chelatococcus]MBS7698790.1 DNA adenine methylase [Chelatococcus sp. YT9]MBX3554628.1 DNA adenine methylase [Chelatococcus sp.]
MESFETRRVHPVRPAAAYIGGKKQLAGQLVERIEAVPHHTYVEPFIGMGGVFLRRTRVPKAEIINDLSGDVATFFRILQRHYVAFMDMLRFQITSRREFERLSACDPSTLTDLERAARFLYLQRTAYGGKVAGRNFGVSPGMPGRFDVTKLMPILDELHDRLAGVIIENLPYHELISRYDGPGVLFYLDPPYWGSEGDYGRDAFSKSDFAQLSVQLAAIEGAFILSINDTPEVRDVFSCFNQEVVSLTYTIANGDGKEVHELIITPAGFPDRVVAQPDLF